MCLPSLMSGVCPYKHIYVHISVEQVKCMKMHPVIVWPPHPTPSKRRLIPFKHSFNIYMSMHPTGSSSRIKNHKKFAKNRQKSIQRRSRIHIHPRSLPYIYVANMYGWFWIWLWILRFPRYMLHASKEMSMSMNEHEAGRVRASR